MKAGWHWSEDDQRLVDNYIALRLSGVRVIYGGYAIGESGIREIAHKTGRTYDAVNKRIRRTLAVRGLPVLDRPRLRSVPFRLQNDVRRYLETEAIALGSDMNAVLHDVVRRHMKCPNAVSGRKS